LVAGGGRSAVLTPARKRAPPPRPPPARRRPAPPHRLLHTSCWATAPAHRATRAPHRGIRGSRTP